MTAASHHVHPPELHQPHHDQLSHPDQHSDHDHKHSRDHQNADGSTESYAHVQGGPVVLDIGGDIGAMVATMDPGAIGTELHLRSEHRPPIEIHTGVWRRRSGGDELTTAVFAELVAGSYWVLNDAGQGVQRVQIQGGALANIDLREPIPVPRGAELHQ